ncbi:hypothetical protein CLV72_109406 [Allonocardiopsis opalescens]|uniref:Uncharacterized protein n=1 Tax=Allonocardiopsis opalescens TaxID=1144618 RepID=A0A2T0PW81_9ACTN|nr:hypothetical protein CLV72_109406 [Allonocardiopsis opalescens]
MRPVAGGPDPDSDPPDSGAVRRAERERYGGGRAGR